MRHDALNSAETSQLVMVDLQIRLIAVMAEADRAAVVKNAEILLQAAAALDIPVVYTEQYPKGLGPTIPAVLESLPATARFVEKTGFSCCAADGFQRAVDAAGRSQIVMIGQETHVCILQTAMDLVAEGFRVFVVEDAVCSRSSLHKRNALLRLRDAGVVITNVESVLFEWVRDAGHPAFKRLSSLLR